MRALECDGGRKMEEALSEPEKAMNTGITPS